MTLPKATTVVIPIHNSSRTLIDSIASLDLQHGVEITLLIVDDASSDNSERLVHTYFSQMDRGKAITSWSLITHPSYTGLAGAYNSGVRATNSPVVVFMQPDIRLPGPNELVKLILPLEDLEVVASTHQSVAPSDSYWDELNLWGKAFLAPTLFIRARGFNGQFDAIRRSALIQIGLFDGTHYRNAGEDGDVIFRLSKVGRIVFSGACAQHFHNFGTKPSIADYLSKGLQYGNAQGALLRNRRLPGILNKIVIFHREEICIFVGISVVFGYKPLTCLGIIALIYSAGRLVGRLATKRMVGPISGIRLFIVELVKHPVHFLGVLIGYAQGRQRLRVFGDLFK
jgi:GT2 family glycosyltransferase